MNIMPYPMCVHATHVQVPMKARWRRGSPGEGVPGSCELCKVGTRTELCFSGREEPLQSAPNILWVLAASGNNVVFF